MSTTLEISVEDATEMLADALGAVEANNHEVAVHIVMAARAVAREEIARSRAPVGEDAYMQAVAAGCYALDDEPTPPAKDTGEGLETTAAQRKVIAYEQSDGSAYRDGDSDEIKAVLRDFDRQAATIANLEARLAEATGDLTGLRKASHIVEGLFWKKIRAIEDERDEARSSLETAERRIGEARDAVKKAAAHAAEGSFVEAHLDHAIGILCAALTPDAGTARSEDEEGQ